MPDNPIPGNQNDAGWISLAALAKQPVSTDPVFADSP